MTIYYSKMLLYIRKLFCKNIPQKGTNAKNAKEKYIQDLQLKCGKKDTNTLIREEHLYSWLGPYSCSEKVTGSDFTKLHGSK